MFDKPLIKLSILVVDAIRNGEDKSKDEFRRLRMGRLSQNIALLVDRNWEEG